MDLSIKTETFGNEDQSWLSSAHGTEMARSITLDVSAFTEATHYPDGYFPSGLRLSDLGDGTFGPQTPAVGEEPATKLAGFLFTSRPVRPGATVIGAALFEHGRVREARLPLPVDATAKADVAGRIIFI